MTKESEDLNRSELPNPNRQKELNPELNHILFLFFSKNRTELKNPKPVRFFREVAEANFWILIFFTERTKSRTFFYFSIFLGGGQHIFWSHFWPFLFFRSFFWKNPILGSYRSVLRYFYLFVLINSNSKNGKSISSNLVLLMTYIIIMNWQMVELLSRLKYFILFQNDVFQINVEWAIAYSLRSRFFWSQGLTVIKDPPILSIRHDSLSPREIIN